MTTRTVIALAATLALGTACASSSEPPSAGNDSTSTPSTGTSDTDDDHGAVSRAEEVDEPQLHLVTVDAHGDVGMLDLLTGETDDLGEIGAPSAVTTDGRYVLATVRGGLAVIDSGMWTWDHGDHFHYYRSDPRLLGTVPGRGAATVATGALSTAGGTGVFFRATGEMVLLDNEAVADGELREIFRLQSRPHAGLVAPFGDGAVVSVPGPRGSVGAVQRVDATGEPVGAPEPCDDARGTITTAVGLVVGCADGALLWTDDGDEPAVERIPYPARLDAPSATDFHGREGRPTVAALAGDTGFWLLDTRERTWRLHDVGVPLLQVVAADDEDGHVVALDRAGRVRVYSAETGAQLAATRPLLAATLRDNPAADGVELVVDQERAYLNAPAEGVVHEIDYADAARVARRLETRPAPTFFAETGR